MLRSQVLNTLEFGSLALLLVFLVRNLWDRSLLRYPFLLIYCVADLLTAGAEYFVQNYGSKEFFMRLYYADEVGIDLVLFLMVITLTYRAMEGNPTRAMAGRVLGVITVLVLGLPFLLFHQSIGDFGVFSNGASEVLNFGAAIMNLVLWTALIGATRRDSQLITVCAGLGLQVTGQALGFGTRHLLPQPYRWIPGMFMAAVHLASIYIWWRAFRPAPRRGVAPMPVANPEIHPGEV
jgi:hypothetical protein